MMQSNTSQKGTKQLSFYKFLYSVLFVNFFQKKKGFGVQGRLCFNFLKMEQLSTHTNPRLLKVLQFPKKEHTKLFPAISFQENWELLSLEFPIEFQNLY